MASRKLTPLEVAALEIRVDGEVRELPLADQLAEARAEAFFHNNQRAIAQRRLNWIIEQEIGNRATAASLEIAMVNTAEEVIAIIDRELAKPETTAGLSGARIAPSGRWICTCYSHQMVDCRGSEQLGSGWQCEKDLIASIAAEVPA